MERSRLVRPNTFGSASLSVGFTSSITRMASSTSVPIVSALDRAAM